MTAVATESGQERLTSVLDDRTALAPAKTGNLLANCFGFRTLDEHAARLCQAAGLAPERALAVRNRLEWLAEAGLLTSYDDLLRRCRAQTGEDTPSVPLAMVGVPSRDRPDMLARGLRSYMANSRDYGRRVEFVVMDDSRKPESREANLAHLTALRREYGVDVSYATTGERDTYVGAVARCAGVHESVVRFGLLNPESQSVSTGASRNALLLHAAGSRFVHVDDDTICRVAPAPNAQPGLALTATHTGNEHSFFANDEDARAAVLFERQDYLALYERVLGWSVADVLSAAANEPIDLDLLRPEFARRLRQAPCRIAVASLGVVGDSGLGSTEMYLFIASEASRARLLAFPGGHRAAFRSQQIIRSTDRTTIAEGGPCLGIGLGIDARGLLPPFMPVGRNSDGVFAQLRLTCCHDTATAYLPWVVEHRPPATRDYSIEEVVQHAGRVGLSTFLTWFVRRFDLGAAGQPPATVLASLASELVRVGSLPQADYEEECRQVLRQRVEGMYAYLDAFEADGRSDTPAAWRDDLAAYMAAARHAVASPEGVVPLELERSATDASAAIRLGQRLIKRYGELVAAWPAIVAAALELRQRGERPARALA